MMTHLEYQMFQSQFKHCMLAELNLLIEKLLIILRLMDS